MDFDKLLKERHSVRKFKTIKKPNYREIINIVNSAQTCPLAGNIHSLRYVIVQDKDKIKELAVAAQQDFISEVEYVIVVCSDNKDLEANYYERGEMYSRQQAGAAIQTMLLKITELSLASCWVGAFSDDTVRRILKIPEDIDIEAMLPIGYELEKTKQPRKPALDDVMYFDKWENRLMKPRRMSSGFQT